jgi:hypothetical protein
VQRRGIGLAVDQPGRQPRGAGASPTLVAGEETALSVGVNVRALPARLLIVTSLVTGGAAPIAYRRTFRSGEDRASA